MYILCIFYFVQRMWSKIHVRFHYLIVTMSVKRMIALMFCEHFFKFTVLKNSYFVLVELQLKKNLPSSF